MALLLVSWIAGVRTPVAPGQVIRQHASIEPRCEECHTSRAGVPDFRCQRCHDPAGAGRLNNPAHVLFGSSDPRKAAAAPRVDCAQCHIDHRGRSWALTRVDEAQCSRCHFRAFSAHPQFAVLRNHSTQAPGIDFPHDKHVAEFAKQGLAAPGSCIKCHEPSGHARDLEPISFDRHCASCHAKEGSVGLVEPIPQAMLIAPDTLAAQGPVNFRLDEFETSRGRISKTFVRHRDDWVLANLRKLRRDVDPEGCAVERGALLARESQLRRKLALSAPLADLDLPALQGREAALDSEIKGVEARIRAQGGAADPPAGLGRLDEVLNAVAASGDAAVKAEAIRLRSNIDALRSATALPAALPPEAVEARTRELLTLLDAVEAADPGLKMRAEDLRRRLLAFNPGEVGVEMLTRVHDQRMAERARVRDEIILRQAGAVSPAAGLLAAEQGAIRDALLETRRRLREIGETAPGSQALAGQARAASLQAFGVLTAACQKCHVLDGPKMLPVRPARPVLVRATFVHAPHLPQADCARCHAGVETSKQPTELNFKGIESCQECHRPRRAPQDCQFCHRYHPRATP